MFEVYFMGALIILQFVSNTNARVIEREICEQDSLCGGSFASIS